MNKLKAVLVLIAISLISLSGCKWNQTGPEPTSVETHIETDVDGNEYTITTQYIDSTPENKNVDPSFFKCAIIAAIVLGLMSLYFWYREIEIEKLKKRCTLPVNGFVVSIRKSRHGDRFLRSKYSKYNATYRYNFRGISIESQNEYYGGRSINLNPLSLNIKEGSFVKIHTDPSDSRAVYDVFADNLRKEFIYLGSFLGIAALGFLVCYIIL